MAENQLFHRELAMNKPPLAGFGLPDWLDLPRPAFPTLDRPATADVAIIGSGIAGLKLARCLARHGLTSLICEASRVGEGASGRNQGSVNHEPGASYEEYVRLHSRQTARDLWELGLENHRMVREQIEEYAIDCDYFRGGMTSLVRHDLPGTEAILAGYRADYELTREDGFDVDWLDEAEATAAGHGPRGIYAAGFRYNDDAQFHSGKYVLGLAQGAEAGCRGVKLREGVRSEPDRPGRQRRAPGDLRPSGRGLGRLSRHQRAGAPVRALLCPGPAGRTRPGPGDRAPARPALRRELRDGHGLVAGASPARRAVSAALRRRSAAGGTRQPFPPVPRGRAASPSRERRVFTLGGAPAPARRAIRHSLSPICGDRGDPPLGATLQSFTADHLPLVGCLEEERRIYGVVGFNGRGNCHSDIGAEYLAGKLAGVRSPIEQRFGHLFEQLMQPGRKTADWGPWKSSITA